LTIGYFLGVIEHQDGDFDNSEGEIVIPGILLVKTLKKCKLQP
jgi:hypothetical protein